MLSRSRLPLITACYLVCVLAVASVRADVTVTAIDAPGLVGNLYVPPKARGRLPAVLLLGGSEGGLGRAVANEASLLAERGYVVLQLAYFASPGLPSVLARVPLEYFKSGIDWLRQQPNVDAQRIGIVGSSKGGEAALLIAAHYPEIKVVVAGVPSNVVWPGIRAEPGASSWTLDGKDLPALPYGTDTGSIFSLYENGLKNLSEHPAAVIEAERIAGPILLVCGRADTLWPSCPMSELVIARLKQQGFARKFELLAYEKAGHAAFGPPVAADSERYGLLAELGGTSTATNAARWDGWYKMLSFLDRALGK